MKADGATYNSLSVFGISKRSEEEVMALSNGRAEVSAGGVGSKEGSR